tara:strand:+ start:29889 stop:30584 length:696 start_codon:yes stop_codon:yes gene_type:complete
MNTHILELIQNANNLSIEEFAKESLKYLKKPEEKDIELMKDVIQYSDNINQKNFLNLLLDLNEKDVLADFEGFLSLYTFIDSEDYEHEDYVEPFSENGLIEGFCGKTLEDKMLPVNSVQIISPLQESEVIVTSTELDGDYFILYHDGGIENLLANSHENFLKSLYILNLMILNEEIFKNTLDLLVEHKEEKIEHVLECVNRIVFSADSIIDGVKNVKDENSLHDYYWKKRD